LVNLRWSDSINLDSEHLRVLSAHILHLDGERIDDLFGMRKAGVGSVKHLTRCIMIKTQQKIALFTVNKAYSNSLAVYYYFNVKKSRIKIIIIILIIRLTQRIDPEYPGRLPGRHLVNVEVGSLTQARELAAAVKKFVLV
jgi:hypothetical protein